MDGNNSKNKSNRCWGATDLEEDEEAYNVYQIPKEKINMRNSVTVGFNKTPELSVPIVEKKKKPKAQGKRNVTTPSDDMKRQVASFTFSHISAEENGDINKSAEETISAQLHKPVEENITKITEIKDNKSISVPVFQNFQPNQIPPNRTNEINAAYMLQAMNYRMVSPPMSYPNYCAPLQYMQQRNPYLPLGNLPMNNPSPRMMNYQQVNATKSTYYERLGVIEVLFRFITQILRSPEQPSIEQIEEIKILLDSLIIKSNENHLT